MLRCSGCFMLLVAFLYQALIGSEGTTRQHAARHWSYHGKLGPNHWCRLFANENPQCCGRKQSPIDVNSKKVIHTDYKLKLTNLNTYNYTITMWNNGHTVMLMLNNDTRFEKPQLSVWKRKENSQRRISAKYSFDSVHFHFGLFSGRGSEHTIDGKAFPMEMHVVYYHSKYGGFDAAKMYPRGLAIIAVHFEISPTENKRLRPLIETLPKIAFQMVQLNITRFSLRDLLPKEINKYYAYEGSLTTPLCNEAVKWYILKQKVLISEIQMSRYRQLTKSGLSAKICEGHQHHNNGHNFLFDNFRPVQGLNGRFVYENNPDGQFADPDDNSIGNLI